MPLLELQLPLNQLKERSNYFIFNQLLDLDPPNRETVGVGRERYTGFYGRKTASRLKCGATCFACFPDSGMGTLRLKTLQ